MKKIYLWVLVAAWILAGCAVQPGDGRGGGNQTVTGGSPIGSQYACFITGKSGDKVSMKVFGSTVAAGVIPAGFDKTGSATVADGAGKSRTVSYNSKTVLFDGKETPPAPYPIAFDLGGKRYMLFGWGSGEFSIYEYQSEDDNYVYFASCSLWNFSAIGNYVKSIMYKGTNDAWILCPAYNDARKTLYFTLCWWVENAVKGDYIKIRVYESALNSVTFGAPSELSGEINPFNPVHYIDGKWHTEADFPGRMGLWWIGRMSITLDGKKAFFNCLNTMSDCGIMKTNSAFVAPIPNNHNFGNTGITDLHDPRLIQTYICSADIAGDGSFTNVRQLSSNINMGGVNLLCDISDDGCTFYTAHMTLDSTFWAYTNWGSDGMALQCCMDDLYNVVPWTGNINVLQNPEYPYAGGNIIRNGDFSSGSLYWDFWTNENGSASMSIVNGEMKAAVINGGTNIWDVGIAQHGLDLENGKLYFFSFRARTDSPALTVIRAVFQYDTPPWNSYALNYFNLTQSMQTFTFLFKMNSPTDTNAGFNFHLGLSNTGNIYIDDVILYETNIDVLPYDDVRGKDLSKDNLGCDLIKTLWFDGTTIFSPGDQTYAGQILESGKNPGLGVNYLHSLGITGSNINVAVIDQNLCQDFGHPEFSNKIAAYFDTGTGQPANVGSMHAPAVASLLVGTHTGTAPGARLYFAATPTWLADAKYFAQALDWIVAQNAGLSADQKIRVVSVSAAPSGPGSPDSNNILWDQAVQRASASNILVLDCGAHRINDVGCCNLENPDDITSFMPGEPNTQIQNDPNIFYAPAPRRSQAEEYNSGVFSYQYTGAGGTSWTIPYIAGVLVMGWQVNPDLSIAKITNYLFQSAYVLPGGFKVINPTNFINTIQLNLASDMTNP